MSVPTDGERPSGPPASLAAKRLRLAARAIDTVIMVGTYWLLETLDVAPPAYYSSLVTGDTLDASLSWGFIRNVVAAPLIALAIWGVFEVVSTAIHGRTIGKLVIGLKVLRADTWTAPGMGKSAGRWIVPAGLFLVPGLGNMLAALAYASAAWNKQGQGWHDKAAGTVVVNSRRSGPRHGAASSRAERPDAPVRSSAGFASDVSLPPAHTPRVLVPSRPPTGYAASGAGARVELASPGRRLYARALDCTLGAAAFVVMSILLVDTVDRSDPIQEFYDGITYGLLVVVGLGVVYEISMIAWRGQTIGKALAGVRVVRAADGTDPGVARSALRWSVVAAPGLPVVLAVAIGEQALMSAATLLWPIVYVSLLWGRDHQGWHDKAAKTLVVRD